MADQTQLLAFDRQNHMGASDSSAASLTAAIREEAEALLADKRVVETDVAIRENKEKMKARPHSCWAGTASTPLEPWCVPCAARGLSLDCCALNRRR